jgi:hypothetical protein
VPSEEEIMERNANTIQGYFGIKESAALSVASEMSLVGIGEIDEMTVVLNDEYVKEFSMVDKDGRDYYIVMDGRGYPTYIFKDKPRGELLFTLPPM